MALMRRLIRDPLLHFAIVGGVLFFLHARYIAAPDAASGKDLNVVVDDATLLNFMQLRAKVFAEDTFRKKLASMSTIERKRLVDDYVREEVLYREALGMGMDQEDYLIRRRLVQKLEFVTETLSRRAARLSDEDVRKYFQAHLADYRVAATITFTHVFFDAERRGAAAALAEATRAAERLNADHVPFQDAVKYTDRFPFQLNYVERTPDFVAQDFGRETAHKIWSLDVAPGRWQGPFVSPYGAHVVMVTGRTEARDAKLEEIEGRVRQDAELDQKNQIMQRAIDELIAKYHVKIVGPENQAAEGEEVKVAESGTQK